MRSRFGRRVASRGLGLILLAGTLACPTPSRAQPGGGTLELSKAEREWLAAHPRIRLAAYANYPPGQFLDDNGRHAGFAADYQHLVEAMLGIEFAEEASHNWGEVLQKAQTRRMDVLALAAETPDRLAYLAFTTPYIDLPAVIIARDVVEGPLAMKDLEGMRVSFVSGYAVESYLHEKFPDYLLDPVPDTQTGLRKVSFGVSDVLVSDLSVASHFIETEGITNLHIVGESGFTYHMGFAVRSDWPELVAIIEKAVATITPEQRQEIFDRWIRLAAPAGIETRRFWMIVLGGIGIAGLLLGGSLVWNRTLQRQVDGKTQEINAELLKRRETSEALRVSEERIRRVIDTALDGVITMDVDGIITGWSRQAAADFGWARDDAIGRRLADLIIPEQYRAAHAEGLARYLETGEARVLNARIEITALHHDGHEFPIELSIAPIEKGDTVEFSAFVRDITARKQAETELTQHREHLEEKVAERTAELRQAKDDADVANRAKSEFLANMSHEIRTPMTAILGFAAMLRELGDLERAPRERIDALDTIRRNGDHLLALINDILDLSKLESGKMTVEHVACSPDRIAGEVIELMQVRADEKGLTLDVRHEDGVPGTIHTDPTRVRQILVNLVGNALKFTDTGGVTVSLRRVDGADADDRRLAFDVTDTGIGMNETQQRDLFEPFTQADMSTSRRFGGTGLGLSISKRFARLLEGDIEVTSHRGAGSTFTLVVPCARSDVTATAVGSPDAAGDRDARSTSLDVLRGRRVLLAEDTPDNQRLIRYHLEKVGLDVDIATNGREVVEHAVDARRAGHRFDVVLMDIQMPEMDGYAAARALADRGFDAPVIALTASTMLGDRERCLAAGMVDHVAKPIDPPVLLAALVRAINATGPRPEPDTAAVACVVDRAAVRERFESPDLLCEVIDLFLGQSVEVMDAIRRAVASGDLEDLGRRVHKLKGSVSNFAASAVTQAVVGLEKIAQDGDRDALTPAVAEVERQIAALRQALADLKTSG